MCYIYMERKSITGLRSLLRVLCPLVAVTLQLLACGLASAASSKQQNSPAHMLNGKPMRISIINSAPYHMEVTAGVLHAFKLYRGNIRLHLDKAVLPVRNSTRYIFNPNPGTPSAPPVASRNADFFNYAVGYRTKAKSLPFGNMIRPADLMFFVTPEARFRYVAAVVRRSKPAAVIFLVHNANEMVNTTEGRMMNVAAALHALHRNAFIAALSPHVVKYIRDKVGVPAFWWFSVLPYWPSKHASKTQRKQPHACVLPPAAAAAAGAAAGAAGGASSRDGGGDSQASKIAHGSLVPGCLSGFTLSGRISVRESRRDYGALFDAMLALPPAIRAAVNLTIIGSTTNATKFLDKIPAQLKGAIGVRFNLTYPEYYRVIHHAQALLTQFGSDEYYTTKCSATLITTLITATPVIMGQRALGTYTFLPEDAIYLQKEDETTAQVMQRVLAAGQGVWLQKRATLTRVRQRINSRARAGIADIVARITAEPAATIDHSKLLFYQD